MKKEMVEQLDEYQQIAKEIEVSKKYGSDFASQKGALAVYINRLHPSRLKLRVTDIFEETPSAKTLRLVASGGDLPPFQAGQYISLFVEVDGIRTCRPYSISSSPNQVGYYDITVKRIPQGLVSNYLLDGVGRGDELTGSGPEGHFYFNPIIHKKTMVCIAGGSGITPFISMIREITDRGLDRKVHLFYGNKTDEDIIFHGELSRLAQRFNTINYEPVIEEPTGRYDGACGFVTAGLILDLLGGIEDKSFFICGPQGLYDFCLPELERLGLSRGKVRQEMYGPPHNIWEHPGWPAKVTQDDVFTVKLKNGRQFEAKAGEPLLTALEKNHVVLPSLCRCGECSLCRVKILSGTVFQPVGVPVRKSDRQFGYVHCCVSYPLENLEIII
jgi:ferredoxin-NADP reductase